jgi:hypothetical protein
VDALLLIDAAAAVAFAVLWYCWFVRYNRRRGMEALQWMDGEGRVVGTQWLSNSRLQAQLRIAGQWFERAQVTVDLFPRPFAPNWLYSLCRRHKETLTFEADLDYVPSIRLEVARHRWFTRQGEKEISNRTESKEWSVFRPGPVVLTTRPEWSRDLPPVVHTFMTSRGHNLVSVRFRPQSPHLSATVPLDALCDTESAAGFMRVLRDLAAGAGTLRR